MCSLLRTVPLLSPVCGLLQASDRSQPASRGGRRLTALHTCTYSVHAAEQLLRSTGRALLAEDSCRAHIGLRQLVRVCAGLLPGSAGVQQARHQTLSLLKMVLWPADSGRTVVDFDPFGLVVMLSQGLVTLAVGEEEGLMTPAGSLQVGTGSEGGLVAVGICAVRCN